MTAGRVSPFSSVNSHCRAVEYFVPSLKMWPTSMPRAIASGLPQRGQGSPARACANDGPLARPSRPARGRSPRTCQSRRPAPVTALTAPRTDSSATMRTLRAAACAARRNPTGAPVAFSTFSSDASARCSTPSAFFRATSLTSRSPAQQRHDEALLGLVDEALDHPRGRDAEERRRRRRCRPCPGVSTSSSAAPRLVRPRAPAARPVSAFSRFAP